MAVATRWSPQSPRPPVQPESRSLAEARPLQVTHTHTHTQAHTHSRTHAQTHTRASSPHELRPSRARATAPEPPEPPAASGHPASLQGCPSSRPLYTRVARAARPARRLPSANAAQAVHGHTMRMARGTPRRVRMRATRRAKASQPRSSPDDLARCSRHSALHRVAARPANGPRRVSTASRRRWGNVRSPRGNGERHGRATSLVPRPPVTDIRLRLTMTAVARRMQGRVTPVPV